MLTTISLFTSLSSTTIITNTANAHSSVETIVIRPSGVLWKPLGHSQSDVPQLPLPELPFSSLNRPGSTPIVANAPASTVGPTAAQSSVSYAFEDPNLSETTVVVGDTILQYSKGRSLQSSSSLSRMWCLPERIC